MFDKLLGIEPPKYSSLIFRAMVKIGMIKQKMEASQKFLKEDIAELLGKGSDDIAYAKAETLILLLTVSSCYDFVEKSCMFVYEVPLQLELSGCPEEYREAISSLMFAAAWFPLQELRDLRKIFQDTYGSSLEQYVNQEFAAKMIPKSPTLGKKVRLMRKIASDFSIEWDSKAFKLRMSKSSALSQDPNLIGAKDIPVFEEKTMRKKLSQSFHQDARDEEAEVVTKSRSSGQDKSSHGLPNLYDDEQNKDDRKQRKIKEILFHLRKLGITTPESVRAYIRDNFNRECLENRRGDGLNEKPKMVTQTPLSVSLHPEEIGPVEVNEDPNAFNHSTDDDNKAFQGKNAILKGDKYDGHQFQKPKDAVFSERDDEVVTKSRSSRQDTSSDDEQHKQRLIKQIMIRATELKITPERLRAMARDCLNKGRGDGPDVKPKSRRQDKSSHGLQNLSDDVQHEDDGKERLKERVLPHGSRKPSISVPEKARRMSKSAASLQPDRSNTPRPPHVHPKLTEEYQLPAKVEVLTLMDHHGLTKHWRC